MTRSLALPNLTVGVYQERRLRRRWPGVSAGLSLGEARPAHAGPQPWNALIQMAYTSDRPVPRGGPSPSLPIVRLAATASRSP